MEVRSADGTPLAVWAGGQGPPLVLVHGSLCDHSHSDPAVAAAASGGSSCPDPLSG